MDDAPAPVGWRWTAAAALALVALTLVGYGHLLRPGFVPYSPHSDLVAEHLASKQVLWDAVREGRLPFWREDQLSGYSGLGNPQAQYTYPLHALFYLLPPNAAAGPTLWLHFLLAGLALWAVGAALGLRRSARLVMAAAGAFSFKLIIAAYAGWLPYISTIALFPLLFATVPWAWRRPGLASVLGLSVAATLSLLSGQLQLVYYSAGFLGLYLLWDGAGELRSGRARALPGRLLALAAAVGLALALAAHQLIPLAAESAWLSRGQATYDFFLGGHALGVRPLSTLLFPEALGTPLDGSYPGGELWEDVAYFGLVPLALAVVGVILGRRRSAARMLAVGFALSLLLGFDTPLVRALFDWAPGFSLFRVPSRFLFLTAFFGIALAGIGLDELLSRMLSRRKAAALAGVVVAAIAAEGTYYAHRYLTTLPSEQVFPSPEYARVIAADPDSFRVAPITRLAVNSGWSASMRLQLISGYDPYNYRVYGEYLSLLTHGRLAPQAPRLWFDVDGVARPDLLNALNVKYLVSPRPHSGSLGDALELVAQLPDQPRFVLYHGLDRAELYVYRNRRARPRAYWAEQVVLARDEAAMRELMLRVSLDETTIALGDKSQPPAAGSPEDVVTQLQASAGNLRASVRCASERFLVLSEIWHPGWQATIDGQPAALVRANGALMGLWVPPGAHQIAASFRPLHWEAALAVSIAAAVLMAAMLAVFALRAGRARNRAGGDKPLPYQSGTPA